MMKTMMRMMMAFAALADVCTVTGVAAEAEVFPSRQVWQYAPVERPVEGFDPIDISETLHGPWLTMPREDSMRVTWIGRSICGGGVEYREKGAEEWMTAWDIRSGLIDCSRDLHSVELKGLKPGAAYEYRLCAVNGEGMSAYTQVYHNPTVRTFRTLDPGRSAYRVFLASDTHGCANMNFAHMYAKSGAKDADFYFFLGDIVNDGVYNDIRFYVTRGFLDEVSRLWGGERPTVFMRGNHDLNGQDAYKWSEYFPQSDGKTYQAFRQGPALFVALDTMNRSRVPAQNAQHAAYLKEQADWIRGLRNTTMWRAAKFRIVMGHICPWPDLGSSKLTGPAFTEVFSDETPEGRIHALVTGHQHQYYRLNPNSKVLHVANGHGDFNLKKYPSSRYCAKSIPERFPFVNLILNAHEAMTVDVTAEKLTFRSHRWYMEQGGYYDAFELYPDGMVKEILADSVEVPVK